MELFHLLNRGVDKRTIFHDSSDYARFVHNLYEFNDSKPAWNLGRELKAHREQFDPSMIDLRSQSSEQKQIVNIHGWCLMGNHYHLLVSGRSEGGITTFIRKLNVGYANYYNERYKRSGTLFQGRTKKIHIATDAHYLHILHYIHLNPLDFLKGAREWRTGAIQNKDKAHEHLRKYRWSSYNDYCGRRNFPSILTTELFGENPTKFEKETLAQFETKKVSLLTDYELE